MRLEVDIMVYKRGMRVTLDKITIRLGNESNRTLVYRFFSPVNFYKFKRTPERIIRELNHRTDNLRIGSPSDVWLGFASYYCIEQHYVCWLDSEDLVKVKMRRDLKNTVNAILRREVVKKYTRNPSKEKSQMEYRKRSYYGKCKK